MKINRIIVFKRPLFWLGLLAIVIAAIVAKLTIFTGGASKYEKSKIDYGITVNRDDQQVRTRYEKAGTIYKNAANKENEAVIMCAGDLMCEPAMSESCYFEPEYNFKPLFKYVRPVFQQSDLAIANLETMVSESAPYAHETHHVDGRYHCNAPAVYLDALRYAGLDGFVLANNHNADVGYEGLVETLDNIDERAFMRTGLFRDETEKRALVADVNGIKVGILSYTEHINARLDKKVFTEAGCEKLVNRYEHKKLKKDIQAAKDMGAEFILCYMHFTGKEYSHEVIDRQRNLAQELANSGVDCIMGSHTHSLQEYDQIVCEDGRVVPIVYSLGNFVTSDNTSMITRSNIIYKMILKKNQDGKVYIDKDYFIPCRIVEGTLRSSFTVFPTQEGYRDNKKSSILENAQENISRIIGEKIAIDPEGEADSGNLAD